MNDQLYYNEPFIQVTQQMNPPFVTPLWHQRKYSSKDLASCRKAEAESLELIYPAIQDNLDGNLEVSIFEVDQEHDIPLPDLPQLWQNYLHHEVCEGDRFVEIQQVNNWSSPSVAREQ